MKLTRVKLPVLYRNSAGSNGYNIPSNCLLDYAVITLAAAANVGAGGASIIQAGLSFSTSLVSASGFSTDQLIAQVHIALFDTTSVPCQDSVTQTIPLGIPAAAGQTISLVMASTNATPTVWHAAATVFLLR